MTENNNFVAEVWLFDWKKRKWDQWNDLKYGRHSHSCSMALDGEFVVVAGGETEHETVHGGGSQLAEIMEITTGEWFKLWIEYYKSKEIKNINTSIVYYQLVLIIYKGLARSYV